jgi:hypothetical protein
LRYEGIGPGDSYIGMWRIVNFYRYRLKILDQEMRAKTTPSKSRELEKDIRYYSEQITSIYGKLLIHEKPRQSSVEVEGDPQNPLHTNVDLTGLPDADLHALGRILPKLGGSTGPNGPERRDLDEAATTRRSGSTGLGARASRSSQASKS